MDIDNLCNAHWTYVEQVIRNEWDGLGANDCLELGIEEYLRRVGLHYRTAMAHGFKHGVAECRQIVQKARADYYIRRCQ